MAKRADERHYSVELFDGRATATVVIVDGHSRPVSRVAYVEAVRSEREAIAAALEDGLREDTTDRKEQ